MGDYSWQVEAIRKETLGRGRALETLNRAKKLKATEMPLSILENCHDRMVNIAEIVDYNSEKSKTSWTRSARMYSATGALKEAGFYTWRLQGWNYHRRKQRKRDRDSRKAGSSTSQATGAVQPNMKSREWLGTNRDEEGFKCQLCCKWTWEQHTAAGGS